MAGNPSEGGKGSGESRKDPNTAPGTATTWRLLGPITWLMSQSSQHRNLFLGDIGWLVLPAIQLNQCKLYVHKGLPIAYASWARVSDEVHRRMQGGASRLAPGDWRSGEHAWLVDLVAPFGGGEQVIHDVRSGALGGQDVNMLSVDPAGDGIRYRTWKAGEGAPDNFGAAGDVARDDREPDQRSR